MEDGILWICIYVGAHNAFLINTSIWNRTPLEYSHGDEYNRVPCPGREMVRGYCKSDLSVVPIVDPVAFAFFTK